MLLEILGGNMNIAVILAGGSGRRMNYEIPKQFLIVNDKPIIIYTLEAFQKHSMIDSIVVVCKSGWEDFLSSYAKQYHIDKISNIVEGGATSQESIRNAVFSLESISTDEDIVIIHDGVRPIIEENVLSDVIIIARQKGNAISSLPYNEQIFINTHEFGSNKYIPRDTVRRVVTPQAYKLKEIIAAYKKAFSERIGIGPTSYANTMMADLGYTLYYALGSEKNIKITTEDDLQIFKALLQIKKGRDVL